MLEYYEKEGNSLSSSVSAYYIVTLIYTYALPYASTLVVTV
jgi:hypothetical protein